MNEPDCFSPLPKAKRLNVLPSNPEEQSEQKIVGLGRFPSWLHRHLPKGSELHQTSKIVEQNRLHTVCEEAKCPNLLECWSKKTATFLVMGKECTRRCGFCSIDFSKEPKPLEANEPKRIVDAVKQLGLKHVVITMVARDDLIDGGSQHLVKIIRAIQRERQETTIEVLTSDFAGCLDSLHLLLEAQPDIFNHNIETVRSLTPRVRNKATYDRTLSILRYASLHRIKPSMKVKSGLMVGLGETEKQVIETLKDLKEVGCEIVTIGQYLQPNRHQLRVKAFITPDQFKTYEEEGYKLGIPYMYCGPFIRSSYNADLVLEKLNARRNYQ
jgi:lipoic acid synthetase